MEESKSNMIIVRQYVPTCSGDLPDSLRLIFAPWLDVTYNSEDEADGEEVCDEEGGCISSCVNSQTVRGD